MNNLQVRVKTDIVTEPVSTTEAKLFCKVSGSNEDTLFAILITAARNALEKYTNCSFAEKEIHATWVKMPDDNEVELPYGPVISVDKVYKIDEEGTEEELVLNSDYWVYGDQDVTMSFTTFWSTGIKSERSIRIEYTAGYGHTNTETLPAALKLAILKEVVTQYEMREDIAPGMSTLSNESKKCAAFYRKKLWL